MIKTEDIQKIVNQMHHCFVSPNVSDSNGEPANLVDVSNSIAQGLHRIAKAIDGLSDAVRTIESVLDDDDFMSKMVRKQAREQGRPGPKD